MRKFYSVITEGSGAIITNCCKMTKSTWHI